MESDGRSVLSAESGGGGEGGADPALHSPPLGTERARRTRLADVRRVGRVEHHRALEALHTLPRPARRVFGPRLR